MNTEESSGGEGMTTRHLVQRLMILLAASCGVWFLGMKSGALESHQAIAVAVFFSIILGTLFFWNFRLAIAFLGLSVLICTNSLDIPGFVQSSALQVILFLV